MSTRSTTHFVHGDEKRPYAIIYRHSDGYPEGAGADILEFLDQCAKLSDSRFGDPSYLAAKYVVFLARKFATTFDWGKAGEETSHADTRPLDFISVGVYMEDPGDIAFRYLIDCKAKEERPNVTVYGRDYDSGNPLDPQFKRLGTIQEVLKSQEQAANEESATA